MKLLNKYIFKEILSYFSITLLSLTAVLLTVKLIQLTSLIVNKGLIFSQIATIFIAIVPTFLEIAIPMSVLLGVMLAFARLSGDSEIIVMRASGLSLITLSKAVFMFGFFISIIALGISLYLTPWGDRTLNTVLYEIARSKSTAGLDAGLFNKLGKLTVYSESINHASGDLKNVLIQDDRADLERLIVSLSGKILSDDKHQRIIIRLQNGDIHEEDQKRYVITHFDTNQIIINADEIYDPDANISGKISKKMSLKQLKNEKQEYQKSFKLFKDAMNLENNDLKDKKIEKNTFIPLLPTITSPEREITYKDYLKRTANLDLEAGKRFSIPFACLILAIVAMPLGIQPPRAQKAWGAGLSSTIGLCVFITYFGIMSVAMALAEKGSLNPYIALWIPNVIIAILAGVLLQKMNSEKWQSTAHFVDLIYKFFIKFKRNKNDIK
ncbi:MAG: LPS export ABC transporter permease LptF [Bdellovibrionota bacterium]